MGEFFDGCGEILREYLPLIWKGTRTTLEMAALGLLLGGLLGVPLAFLLRQANLLQAKERDAKSAGECFFPLRKALIWPVRACCFLFRSIPFVLQAAILHYGITAANGEPPPPLFSGTLALALFCGVHLADPLGEAFVSWRENDRKKRVRSILFPLIFRFFENAKDVAVLHVIGVTGLYFFADVIFLQGQPRFESFVAVCLSYVGISILLTLSTSFLKRLLREAPVRETAAPPPSEDIPPPADGE